jgi:CheY-like chemotaxis protein
MQEKILIALTDKNLVNNLVFKMKEVGYIVDVVENSKDFLAKVKTFKPDLALVDLNLPIVEGYELYNPVVHKDITKLPVIMVSNSGDPVQMKRIPATPAVKDYIIKFHIEPDEIIQKVEGAFGRKVKEIKIIEDKKSKIPNGKKVLWVEDDKLLSNILSKKLETAGYELIKIANGKEALGVLETKVPDLIILDILLPEMNGFDILQAIKQRANLRGVPVIILSNLSRQTDIERAKNLGANRFLVKAAVSLDEILKETELEMSKA